MSNTIRETVTRVIVNTVGLVPLDLVPVVDEAIKALQEREYDLVDSAVAAVITLNVGEETARQYAEGLGFEVRPEPEPEPEPEDVADEEEDDEEVPAWARKMQEVMDRLVDAAKSHGITV